MTDEMKLLPCPFCGGDAEMDAHQGYRELATGRVGTAIAVYCRECAAQVVTCRADVPDVTPEEVAEQWNTRPTAILEGGDDDALTISYMLGRKEAADAIASRDAEINRLQGELSEARAGERNMSEHVRRVAAEANDGLEALQTLDEFWDAVGYPNNRRLLTPAEQVASIYRERDAAEAERDRYLAALGEAERALEECANDLEAEISARASGELPRRIARDLETVTRARAALSTLKTAREG